MSLDKITHETVFMFDIDGTVCEPQQRISTEMMKQLNRLSSRAKVYFVTGNAFTKSIDMIDGVKFDGIFCNSADELRTSSGRLLAEETDIAPLAHIQHHLQEFFRDKYQLNNAIEWRSPRMVNVSVIGRFAGAELRRLHCAAWREDFIREYGDYLDLIGATCTIGGSVSVDIYSKGADKSRAGKYVNGVLDRKFIFVGDKTAPNGNDFPLVEYCSAHPENISLTTDGTAHTLQMIDKFLSLI